MHMNIQLKIPYFKDKKLLILVFFSLLTGVFIILTIPKAEAEPILILKTSIVIAEGPIIAQGNSILAISDPSTPVKPVRKINMLITAYSSTPWETDESPFITASGSQVRDGIVANNKYPFGTKIRIPELYGDKVFVVEDRMHWEKSNYQLDIWFPEHEQALNFGAKIATVEILEN